MKIREIITKIDENQLFVPAFQREYVWKRDDAKRLIASLINDYPTGTMLTWETNNPPELKGKFKHTSENGSITLILDGQQRITTLYMLINGSIPPYYTKKEIINDIRKLYVHIETLELNYYKKTIMENNPCWLNITDVFKRKISPRDITDKLEIKENVDRLPKGRENEIFGNLRIIESIVDKDFLWQIVPAKATVKEAIDIFYIVNSSGVNLTDAELALAQISGYWPQAREKMKTKLQYLKEKGWVFNLDFMVYVLLAITHNMGSKMEKLHSPDNKEKVKEVWERLESNVLDYTFNIMQSHGYIDHTKEINSVYALIPIITYIYHKTDNKLSEIEIKKIIKWFYYSQLRQRYVSQLPQKLDKDIGIIYDSEDNPFDVLLSLIAEEKPLEIKPYEFDRKGVRHPLFNLMIWYFKSVGAVCLGTGLKLHQNMGKSYGLEKDHIFAYSFLRDSGYFDMDNHADFSLAQEITNRAILTKFENGRKSAKPADVYLRDIKNSSPNSLSLQCIPENEELWKLENFRLFIEERRKLLTDRLNDFLTKLSLSNEQVKTKIDFKELIENGESNFLELKSTLRWDIRQNVVNTKLEHVILKSVAAFNNAEGGKLIIGVGDDFEILGLDNDYNTLKEANKDYFELHLRNLINNNFGKDFGATHIKMEFPIVDDTEICVIDIKKGIKPLYLEKSDKSGTKQKKFYLRNGNSSQELEIDEATLYVNSRFNESYNS